MKERDVLERNMLRQWLITKQMTQRELAQAIGCREQYLCDMLNGRKRPTVPMLRRMAQATGLSADMLLGLAPEPDWLRVAQAAERLRKAR
jgi:transcriptional regulator with XRE-family HTH domain